MNPCAAHPLAAALLAAGGLLAFPGGSPARSAASADSEGCAPPPVNSVETILEDMQLPHEGRPHGLPESCNWAQHPRMGPGADPGSFTAMTAWGQLYEAAGGNPAQNTRVHIRNIRAYVLSKQDRQWHRVQASADVAGAAFREDFAFNESVPAALRAEPDGGISVKAGGGRNFHFWPATRRAAIDRQDLAGVFVTVQARLVVDDPAKPDDRDQARYLLGAGGDYWKSRKSPWFFWKTNKAIAIGRFKYVRPCWQAFNITTLSPADLRQNPPPLE